MTMTINELVCESYATAKAKGWHDAEKDATVGDRLALIHSEISEALEEYRDGKPLGKIYHSWQDDHGKRIVEDYTDETPNQYKPEGFTVELADVLIRIFDMAGKYALPLEAAIAYKLAYNLTRPHRHGNKVV